MRYFYEMYPTAQNRQQSVDDFGQDIIFYIPWGHHVQILGKCKSNPTVGLLICKDLDKVEAQYALESSSQPIGVSSYELSKLIPEEFKGSMPTIEEIEAEFGDID